MYKIKKRLGPYPFAHRQHTHDGHCALVHGHNWYFEIELFAHKLDKNGFVFDFGKFKILKELLAELFDHTIVLSQSDPALYEFTDKTLFKVTALPSASAEGLAKFVAKHLADFLKMQDEDKRVGVSSVTVIEDEKNSATYIPEPGALVSAIPNQP